MEKERDTKWLYEYSTDNYMNANNPEIRSAKKELLKQGYSKTKRAFEATFMVIVALLLPCALYNVFSNLVFTSLLPTIVGTLCGILFADFMSGVVHWAADTWGTLDVPFFGPTYIRSFREHHVSPTAMCEHDIIETNGDNFMLVILPLYFTAQRNMLENSVDGVSPAWWDVFTSMFWIAASIGVAMTNQIHKWSHTYRVPSYVTTLQKLHIILPKENHSLHHRPAFDGYYCITTGWLNPILEGTGFWKSAEYFISKATGLVPREDDWKWTGLVASNPEVVERYMASKKEK